VVRQSPVWNSLHELELGWVRAVTAPIEARAYRRMPAVLVNYRSVEKALVEHYGSGMCIRRITYSPPTAHEDPPVDSALPAPLRGFGDQRAPLIVSVSRHDGRKGLDLLIEALARLRDAGIAFRACLVGTGELLAAHRRLVASLGLEAVVSLPGKVPDVLPYLTNCDAFVLPSREEGSGSVSVLEALQVGVPIVATAIDGIPEDLTHGHDSLLVPAGNAHALARTLATLLDDAALRGRLAAAARLTYERRFAPATLTRELASLYSEFGLRPAR
jgi:glycosyltransferase involved in cell wall biosynthesis